jgi:hypothetical protein
MIIHTAAVALGLRFSLWVILFRACLRFPKHSRIQNGGRWTVSSLKAEQGRFSNLCDTFRRWHVELPETYITPLGV